MEVVLIFSIFVLKLIMDEEFNNKLLRGERPEGMSYEDYKKARNLIKKYLKLRKRYGINKV